MSSKLIRALFFFVTLLTLCVLFILPASAMTDDGKIVIMIDPGHGGNDPGAVNGKTYESTNALRIAEEMKTILEKTGKFKVYLTRTDNDTYMLRYPRAVKADEKNADFCISLHFNSSTDSKLKGTQILASVKKEYYKADLCSDLLSRLTSSLGTTKLGILREKDNGSTLYYWSSKYKWDAPFDNSIGPVTDYYGLLNWCSKFGIPSIIVEHCFISNKSDLALIQSDSSLKKMAQADAGALIEYYTNHEHVFTEERVTDYPASCVYGGKSSYHCTVCGARKSVKAIRSEPDPDGHFWYLNDYKSATCTEEGYKTYVCAYSKSLLDSYITEVGGKKITTHTKTEKIPATGHKYKLIGSEAPKHAKDGYKIFKCENCGDQYTETLKMTDDHDFKETERKPASCTDEGYVLFTCSVCGETKKETLPTSDAHEYENTAEIPASCEKDGEIRKKCRLCGSETTEVLPAVGHDYQEKESKKPTCTEDGYVVLVCTKCGIETTGDFAPLGHMFEEKEVDGNVYHVCSVCGFSEDMPPIETETAPIPESQTSARETEVRASEITETDAPDETEIGGIPKTVLYASLSGVIVLAAGAILAILLVQKKKRKEEFSYVGEEAEAPASEKEEIK